MRFVIPSRAEDREFIEYFIATCGNRFFPPHVRKMMYQQPLCSPFSIVSYRDSRYTGSERFITCLLVRAASMREVFRGTLRAKTLPDRICQSSSNSPNTRSTRINFADSYQSKLERPFSGWQNAFPFFSSSILACSSRCYRNLSWIEYQYKLNWFRL